MLGCQDFCGYYDWTFHYLRRNYGPRAVEKYWAEAIAADAQRHYIESGRSQGLRGLYQSWSTTGVSEQCDWTVTLDEDNNLLRLDMRQCPSKGFLLDNDLNADEDYCDHCMGWIGPALSQIGAEVAAHEHNHCGQCWWEIRAIDKSQPLVEVSADIRKDPRWGQGYLHRYAHHEKLPLLVEGEDADSCNVLVEWFRHVDCLAVIGPMPIMDRDWPANDAKLAVIVSGHRYAAGDYPLDQVEGVILEHDPEVLPAVAQRYLSREKRPLLMHAYLPGETMLNFAVHGLPRAIPILPLLIRSGVYRHQSNRRHPEAYLFAVLLAAALQKRIIVRGLPISEPATTVDAPAMRLGDNPTVRRLAPSDVNHLRKAWQHVHGQIDFPASLRGLFNDTLKGN